MAKKILILGVALIMGLGLFTGCGGSNTGKVISDEPFYSLQAGYNQKWLSKNDLKSIANFHSQGNSETLSEQVESAIKQAYSIRYPQEEAVDVIINKYLGTYNNCVAIMIGYLSSGYTSALWSETIGGVKIQYTNGQRILIFKINK